MVASLAGMVVAAGEVERVAVEQREATREAATGDAQVEVRPVDWVESKAATAAREVVTAVAATAVVTVAVAAVGVAGGTVVKTEAAEEKDIRHRSRN